MASTVPRAQPVRAVNRGDALFRFFAGAMAASVLVVMAGMVLSMVRASAHAIGVFGLGFFVGRTWDPVQGVFGALPFLYGTVASALLALLIAVPLALGVAIFLAELAPAWIRNPIGFLIELLAAIPSVIYGLWGLLVLAPWLRRTVEPFLGHTLGFLPLFQGPPLGIGMLAAGFILAIMVLPLIVAVGTEVLRAVPMGQREAALALGATRWETSRMAVLPYARSGLVGAMVLALARALGETMAVTMVIGNRPDISLSLFAPSYTIAAVIANEFAEATTALYQSALLYIGLVLFLVTVIVNVLARVLVARVTRGFVEVRD